jgi:hypothetical protein
MTAHFYLLRIGVSDSATGGDIIEVRLQYISVYQLYLIIEAMQNMLERFKHTAEPYYTIINDTINTMNLLLSEVEGNTVFCSISRNLQSDHVEAITAEFIGSLDENTMDITIDSEVPLYAHNLESLTPFLYTVNQRRIFIYGIQSPVEPQWTQVLRDLELSA